MAYRVLHLDDALDILKFGFGSNRITTTAATQTAEDVSCFLFAVDFDKPPRRLGEEPDDSEEYQKKYYLECNREPPAEGRSAAIDEGQATDGVNDFVTRCWEIHTLPATMQAQPQRC